MAFAPLNRRTFLRSAGVAIGLPLLDAMLPVGPGAEQKAAAMRAKRMILIGRPLGLHTPFLFPTNAGKDHEVTRYLQPLQDHRGNYTVFSGMSHVGYNAGHGSEVGLLTGVSPEGIRPGDVRNTISLDQEVASRIGKETRYASLQFGGGSLSANRKGQTIPSEWQATRAFKQLFIDGTPAEVAREVQRIRNGQSILDGVRDQANSLAKTLGPADKQRIDLLMTSIREAEQRLQQDQEWVKKPKPKVSMMPVTEDHGNDGKMLDRERQWYDIAHLALQTDSTRVMALHLHAHGERLQLPGLSLTPHDASHHGQDESKIKQLALIEDAEMKLFSEFLTKMKTTEEGGANLLDQTVIFHASNLGNGSSHSNDNLPIVLAGGGFKHAGHLAYDRKNNKQLSNLFVRMLHQMGIEMERFGSSNGVISEI